LSRSKFVVLATVLAAACSEPPLTPLSPASPIAGRSSAKATPGPEKFVVVASAQSVSSALIAGIQAAGGTITGVMDSIGVVVATSTDPNFASRAAAVAGVSDVGPDATLQFSDPNQAFVPLSGYSVVVGGAGPVVGASESFRAAQWAPDAIKAPAAWQLGAQGAGARVAILDGGIHSAHADIAPNLDVARSVSFVSGQPFNSDVGDFWHGTHVAGIVAAPANGIGTVGIAPQATLIGVKVLHAGVGDFSAIIGGIYYAASPIASGGAGADVVNMSLGAVFSKKAAGAKALIKALNRATDFADKRGVLLIASAGNNYFNFDQTQFVSVPAMSNHVLSVSATGPVGFALGASNFDRPASYSNIGKSIITFAAPGGDFVLPGEDLCSVGASPNTITAPCWAFDMVLAPCRGIGASTTEYCFSAGTSMAAPAVAGVAALIVGTNPSKYRNAHAIETQLRHTSDDLGANGPDAFYGVGRVNALRAVSE